MPFGYVFAAGACLTEYRRALERVIEVIRMREDVIDIPVLPRPARGALVHMRALQAYDGFIAGASQREIAGVLFGESAVASKWQPDSDVRAQVRYLIASARAYINGDYIKLLGGRRQSGWGENAPSIDPP